MFCPKCGRELPDSAKYCSFCGEKLVLSESQNITGQNATNTSTTKKKGTVIIIIAGAALLTVALTIGSAFFRQEENAEMNVDDVSQDAAENVLNGADQETATNAENAESEEMQEKAIVYLPKSIVEYGTDGAENRRTEYTFDAADHTLTCYSEWIEYTFNPVTMQNECTERTVYQSSCNTYSKNGQVIKTTCFNVDGSVSAESIYHSDGRLKEETQYFSDHSWCVNEYDDNDHQIKRIVYSAEGLVESWIEIEYDTSGNEIKEIEYRSNGSIENTTEYEYEYDAKGNVTKKICYYNNSVSYWYEYGYDTSDNLVKEIQYRDGAITVWHEWEYNAEHDQTKQVVYNSDGTISSWKECEYDANHNLIKEIMHHTDGETSRTEYEYQVVEFVDEIEENSLNNTTSNLAISVDFEHKMDGEKEYAVITGLDDANGVVWTYQTDQYECAELDRVSDLGSRNGFFYYVENGIIAALNISNGKKVWENTSFGGSPSTFAFDEDGNLYICGYHGPDLFVVSESGETINKVEAFSSDYYWPIEISCSEGIAAITYEGTPSGAEEILNIHLNDYSYTVSEQPLTWEEQAEKAVCKTSSGLEIYYISYVYPVFSGNHGDYLNDVVSSELIPEKDEMLVMIRSLDGDQELEDTYSFLDPDEYSYAFPGFEEYTVEAEYADENILRIVWTSVFHGASTTRDYVSQREMTVNLSDEFIISDVYLD